MVAFSLHKKATMHVLEKLKIRAAKAWIKFDDSFGVLWTPSRTQDHSFRDWTLRIPVVDWRAVKEYNPDSFVQLLRSDELPTWEMRRFRSELAEEDWQARDREISEARALRNLPIVSEKADKHSDWAKQLRRRANRALLP